MCVGCFSLVQQRTRSVLGLNLGIMRTCPKMSQIVPPEKDVILATPYAWRVLAENGGFKKDVNLVVSATSFAGLFFKLMI